MNLPSYQDLMLPLLRVLGTAASELHQKECTRQVSDLLQLTEEQRQARLPSGIQTYIHNRTGWAGRPMKGYLCLSEESRKLLAQ